MFMGHPDNTIAGLELARTALPRDPSCAARARSLVRSELGGRVGDEALERMTLAASELVTNAWKHGEGSIELRIDLAEDRVRIEVIDEGTGAGPAIRADTGDDGGWGLRIVEDLALRWGCLEGATHVWAEFALD